MYFPRELHPGVCVILGSCICVGMLFPKGDVFSWEIMSAEMSSPRELHLGGFVFLGSHIWGDAFSCYTGTPL